MMMDKRRMAKDFVDIMDQMENVRNNRKFVMVEILLLSGAIGYYFGSWIALIGSVIILAILFVIPFLRAVIFLFLSIIWGLIGFAILALFLSTNLAIAGGAIIGLLVFFIHLGSR
jgi:hypothetical protein